MGTLSIPSKIHRSLLAGLSVVVLLLSGCSKDDPGEEAPKADNTFKSISVSSATIVLGDRESATVEFAVVNPGYVFNYDVSSPRCQVGLYVGGKAPNYYRISSITKGNAPGRYQATIVDLGLDPIYNDSVSLGMTLEDGSVILSGSFIVQSEYASSGKTIVRTGLPVVYIDTEGGQPITSKEDYLKATFSVLGMGASDNFDEVTCQIRGRGNTTWYWSKKPYLIKFDAQQALFGMHRHKRYVLLANLMDPTLMRNIVALKVSSLTSLAWTPAYRSVEVVLNGRHIGNYLLVEQVRVDKNRVAVDEKEGYLLELDFHFDNEIQWISPYGRCNMMGDGIPFAVKNPDSDVITSSQVSYIKDYINTTASTLYGDNYTDPARGYARYIDVDSFVDYWIVYELMMNHEVQNPGSVYMYKDVGGKLAIGPVWDFDWGVLSYNVSPGARTGLMNSKAIWYERLFSDPAFKARVKKRWQELLPQFETIPAFIEQTRKELSASAALDRRMWDPAEDRNQNGGWIINGDENLSFDEATTRIRNIFSERLEVISKNL